MKKIIYTLTIIILSVSISTAQKYICRDGQLGFFSSTPVEDIEAINNQASGIIDTESGNIVVTALMKSFEFEKALMQEHFNENYVESDKFPKTKFKGVVVNNSEIDYSKEGEYKATVSGDLTIHGVTKSIETVISIIVNKDGLSSKGKFIISPEDYDIKIPSVVKDKIAKDLEIRIDMSFIPLPKKK